MLATGAALGVLLAHETLDDQLCKHWQGRHALGHEKLPRPQLLPPVVDLTARLPCCRATSVTEAPGNRLSAAIHARSAFVRRLRPVGPLSTSSREAPPSLESSKWAAILPSRSKPIPPTLMRTENG